VDLGADVLALVALPSPAPGKARVAAALADDAVAVVTLSRSVDPGDEAAIELDPEAVETSTRPAVSSLGSLGFQPVALAIAPGDGSHVWAASPDLNGVARIDVDDASGAPSFTGTVLNALAPTRLVAAARLAERPDAAGEDGLDPLTWATTAPVERVYAVLDESSCGLDAEIACGLVALDPATGELALDPAPVGTTTLPFRASIRRARTRSSPARTCGSPRTRACGRRPGRRRSRAATAGSTTWTSDAGRSRATSSSTRTSERRSRRARPQARRRSTPPRPSR
jgi:hypothetical protein